MITENFRIETPRLILRPFTPSDRDAIFEIQSKPEMTCYTPDDTWQSAASADDFIRFAQSLYTKPAGVAGFRYFFAVILKASGNLIGYSGVGGPAFDLSLTEVFYGIDVPYWGQGYATELTRALLQYSFTELKLQLVVGFAEAENIASLRVLEKAGMKYKGLISDLPEIFNYFNGECLFELTRDEWLELTAHQIT